MSALVTYESQVEAIRRWTKDGLCHRSGTWSFGSDSGDLWYGEGYGFRWSYSTKGRMLVPGTFRVEAI